MRDAALGGVFDDRYCVEHVKVITAGRGNGLQRCIDLEEVGTLDVAVVALQGWMEGVAEPDRAICGVSTVEKRENYRILHLKFNLGEISVIF
jgi:hypothetical protein